MLNKRGFTLIELLVVIAIIGLLSVMAVVSFNNAREKARDARRVGDLKQLNNAMQLYIESNNRAPASTGGDGDQVCIDSESCWQSGGDLATALSQHSSPLPTDPHPESATGYYYVYVSPEALMAVCATCNIESYQLYIIQLEGTSSQSGFNDSEYDDWVAP